MVHSTKEEITLVSSILTSIDAQIERVATYATNTVNGLYGELVKNTPVGNPDLWLSNYHPPGYVGGTARANWRIVETPDDEVIHSTSISAVPEINTNWKQCYIINNVPYIWPLEYGHSSQVDAGWIRRAIEIFS